MSLTRRSFLRGLLAGAAIATGLARTRIELVDDEPSFSEIVAQTLRMRANLVRDNVIKSNALFRYIEGPVQVTINDPTPEIIVLDSGIRMVYRNFPGGLDA